VAAVSSPELMRITGQNTGHDLEFEEAPAAMSTVISSAADYDIALVSQAIFAELSVSYNERHGYA
jgi:hypothetical protein